MEHEQAKRIFDEIGASTRDDDLLLAQKRELLTLANRYARIRTDWQMASREERIAMDAARRTAHDALLDQCNILGRAVGKAGRDNEWRRALGQDRKEIGDFACHVHAILGVMAR